MKHLGDITKLNGAEVPIVDVICGGSPCQDLSVAGKRAGLAGERSGLFMDQIRIIKEMREHDRAIKGSDVDRRSIRPRYMVWENVPGAFSSNKGEDFRAVLEETAKVVCEDAIIPRPTGGKWSPSGCIMGDGWSIAWRVHDAQFWGVPQRRKRISLVADFGGETAPEILFEREGVSGDITESGKERQGTATDVEGSIGETIGFNRERCGAVTMNDAMPTLQAAAGESGNNQPMVALSFQERAGKPGGGKGILIQNERTGALSTLNNQSVCCLNDQGGSVMGVSDDITGALRAQEHGHQPIVFGISAYESNAMKSGNPNSGVYVAETARTLDLNGGSPACNQGGMAVVCLEGNGSRPSHKGDGYAESDTGTGGGNVPMVMEQPVTASKASYFMKQHDDGVAETLVATDYKDPQLVAYGLDRASFNQGINAKYDFSVEEEKIATQTAKDPGAVLPWTNSIVRRLTPMECERLQGYPDGWTDIGEWTDSKGKLHKDADSPRYKALGNSIALPFWEWMAKRMVSHLDTDHPTMASLFDGIGGFPLVYSRAGCEPIWASEIEEFPIAVTKVHFPERSEDHD